LLLAKPDGPMPREFSAQNSKENGVQAVRPLMVIGVLQRSCYSFDKAELLYFR